MADQSASPDSSFSHKYAASVLNLDEGAGRTSFSPIRSPTSLNETGSEIQWSETAFSDDGNDVLSTPLTPCKHFSFAPMGVDMSVVTIQSSSSGKCWREHHSVFTERSSIFRELLGSSEQHFPGDAPAPVPGVVRIPNAHWAFKLQDVTDEDFDSLMLTLKPKLGQKLPLYRLRPALILATRWGFDEVREYAINEIPSHSMDPIDRIALARQTNVTEWNWLGPPYIALSVRLAPLEQDELATLGPRATSAIQKARQAVLLRRMDLIKGDKGPAWMGNSWWHKPCWKTLYEAWRQLIAWSRPASDEDNSPHELLMKALEKRDFQVDGRPPKPLCASCDVKYKIFGWISPWTENELAESVLLEVLLEHVE